MKSQGISDQDIDSMNKLFDLHRIGGANNNADDMIVSHLKANDSVGKALKMQIDMEEALYQLWMKNNSGKDTIYRKGQRRTGVEPWTTRDDGADMGSGGIGWDHQSTVSALLKQGYRILGGMGRHLGSPGEAEITMVKF